jgi:hypothetical protein
MKTSAKLPDPQLAWALWHGLTKLSLLLWDCYEKEFLKLAEEERVSRGQASQEDREIETPF